MATSNIQLECESGSSDYDSEGNSSDIDSETGPESCSNIKEEFGSAVYWMEPQITGLQLSDGPDYLEISSGSSGTEKSDTEQETNAANANEPPSSADSHEYAHRVGNTEW